MKIEVPFYSQNWNLDDWQKLGYKDREDASYWERSSCGILCIKMIMDAFLTKEGKKLTPAVKEIIDRGVALGAYSDKSGWSHQGLGELAGEFGLKGIAKEISIQEIKDGLLKGALPIVSIKWGLRTTKNFKEKVLFWKKYGGHLAVVVGFEEEDGKIAGLYLHHTSKLKEQNWKDKYVPVKDFLKTFTGRGLIITCDS
jgi:hypothetical protein